MSAEILVYWNMVLAMQTSGMSLIKLERRCTRDLSTRNSQYSFIPIKPVHVITCLAKRASGVAKRSKRATLNRSPSPRGSVNCETVDRSILHLTALNAIHRMEMI